MNSISRCFFLPLAGILASGLYAQTTFPYDTFLTIPSADPKSINNSNDIVGILGSSGFLRSHTGTLSFINYPGAAKTEAWGINNLGAISGTWFDSNSKAHGFIRRPDGTFLNIDYAGLTGVFGINDNNDVVGEPSFVRNGQSGVFQTVSPTGVWYLATNHKPRAINNAGLISGFSLGDPRVGPAWIINPSGQTTNFNMCSYFLFGTPAIGSLTTAGRIVGDCPDAAAGSKGFIREPDGSTSIVDFPRSDYPNRPANPISGLNDLGLITGQVYLQSGLFAYLPFACPITLGSTNRTHGLANENGFVQVSAPDDCAYVVRSNASWIGLPLHGYGPGNGQVLYSLAANASGASRTGTITIGAQTFTITQSASQTVDCTPGFPSGPFPSLTLWANYGSYPLYVVVPKGCTFTISSNTAWMKLSGPATISETAHVYFEYDANVSAAARTAQITVGPLILNVTQAAQTQCIADRITKSPSGELLRWIDSGGGTGAFFFRTNCPANPTSDQSWLTITGPNADGSYSYTALPNNSGATRMATIGTKTIPAFVGLSQPAIGQQTGLRFVPVTPCRVADTRNVSPPSLVPGLTRNIGVKQSACGIPPAAQAYSLNITVVPSEPLAYLTVWPAGQPIPNVSTLNSPDASVVANSTILASGTNGEISLRATNATDVVVDINGYFVDANAAGSLAFYTLPPCRMVDTRAPYGFPPPFGAPSLAAGEASRNFPLRYSSCGIPAEARAYSVNITVLPSGDLAYLTTWPGRQTRPVVSTLNAKSGRILANGAIIPAGADGSVNVFTSANGPVDVLIDVNGYFGPPTANGALSFYPETPYRLLDTRFTTGPLPAKYGNQRVSAPPEHQVDGAYFTNITLVPTGPIGFLTVYPPLMPVPNVSTLNSLDGRVVANGAIVSALSEFSIFTFAETDKGTDVVIDVNGTFRP